MPHRDGRMAVAAVALAAVLFGLVTVIAGSRVLLGADPGYVVYLPLLRFNTIMGAAYVAVGVLAWRSIRLGVYAAAAICVLNVVALGAVSYLFTSTGLIASTSVKAMALRTVVWLVFLAVLATVSRRTAAKT